jgi:hypothetical protein
MLVDCSPSMTYPFVLGENVNHEFDEHEGALFADQFTEGRLHVEREDWQDRKIDFEERYSKSQSKFEALKRQFRVISDAITSL